MWRPTPRSPRCLRLATLDAKITGVSLPTQPRYFTLDDNARESGPFTLEELSDMGTIATLNGETLVLVTAVGVTVPLVVAEPDWFDKP